MYKYVSNLTNLEVFVSIMKCLMIELFYVFLYKF